MGFSIIGNIPMSREEWMRWSFSHAAHHLAINNYIIEIFHQTLPQYVLDPMDVENRASMESWFYQHQAMHSQQDAVLGVAGYDLNSTDFRDPEKLAQWIFTNNALHYLEATATEVWV